MSPIVSLTEVRRSVQLVDIARDVFGRGDTFVQKITGRVDRPLQRIRDVIDSVIDNFAELDTQSLLDRVYDMCCYTLESPGHPQSIKAIPAGRTFTGILEEEEAEESLVIPPGWQITLELTFHPDALRNLQRGIEDTHAGRLYGLEALGADV